MVDKLQETRDQERINAELQEIKKKEGEEVEVDANFGKPQENAAQFKDMSSMIKIGKKRTQPEPISSSNEKIQSSVEPDVAKKPKLD
jgi:hypothetical protein